MKYIKLTIAVFVCTLCMTMFNVTAANTSGQIGYLGKTIKAWGNETKIDTQVKERYSQQGAKKTDAIDNLSGDGRALKGKVTNSTWQDLPINKVVKWSEALTYYPAEYSHYIKATKVTMSTVAYYGWWYWDTDL